MHMVINDKKNLNHILNEIKNSQNELNVFFENYINNSPEQEFKFFLKGDYKNRLKKIENLYKDLTNTLSERSKKSFEKLDCLNKDEDNILAYDLSEEELKKYNNLSSKIKPLKEKFENSLDEDSKEQLKEVNYLNKKLQDYSKIEEISQEEIDNCSFKSSNFRFMLKGDSKKFFEELQPLENEVNDLLYQCKKRYKESEIDLDSFFKNYKSRYEEDE